MGRLFEPSPSICVHFSLAVRTAIDVPLMPMKAALRDSRSGTCALESVLSPYLALSEPPLRYDPASPATEPANSSNPADTALPTYVTVDVSSSAPKRVLSSNLWVLLRRLSPVMAWAAMPRRSQDFATHASERRTSAIAPSLLKTFVVASVESPICCWPR